MDPIAALFANWLKMELPVLLAMTEHAAEAAVKSAILAHWSGAKAKIVARVSGRDKLTLDPAQSFTGKDGRVWTHPQAFARDVVYWLWHQFPIGGSGADVVRDLQTQAILSDVVPQLTPDLTPEQAFDKILNWEDAQIPFG